LAKPKKTAMLLAQRIVDEIADSGLPAGTPLLAERDMLEHYGVARGTLREALRFLEMHGVIEIRTGPGGGPVVGAPGSRHLASIIAMLLQLEHAPFGAVLEARLTLEPPMAAYAAARISDAELERLGASVRAMREDIEDLGAFLRQNEVFHEIIATSSGNQVFALIISSLNWIIDGTPLGVDYPIEVRRSICAEHQRIYVALRDRSPARASAAMAVHIGDFATYLERHYPRVLRAPLRWDQVER
jgi:DNA-binding FadR family transcriptional regulator